MNSKKITRTMMKKPSTIIVAATIIAVVASASMIVGMQNLISQNALAQGYGSNGTTAANSCNC
jgi:hypothetical protein